MEFDSFTLVLLRRPADAPDLPDDELDRIQAEHLAYMEAQRKAGALLASGPFCDQDDVALRGACVFALGLEEARAIALQDPAVLARRLEPELMTWLVPTGLARFGA
jgi:uncharacterized protein YciI